MTTATRNALSAPHVQRGTVLLVSTVIVLVLSLLAVALAKTASLQNSSVAVARSAQLARLGADSALNSARAQIARIAERDGADAVCATLTCASRPGSSITSPAAFLQTAAARAATTSVRGELTTAMDADATTHAASAPIYVLEDLGVAPANADSPRRHEFRITAQAVSPDATTTRVEESVYTVAQAATAPR